MPGGNKNINGKDGKLFSSENQPKRYRGVSLITKLKGLLDEEPERAKRIMETLLKKAEEGDLKAVEMVMERIDGKVVQPTEKIKTKPQGRKNFLDFENE